MAQTKTFLVLIFFFFFFNFLSVPYLSCISSRPSNFNLKLIHRDSPLSPLYEPNISDFVRFNRHVKISKSRALNLQRNIAIRLPLKYCQPLFTVELGFGTPSVQRTLAFDTGSDLTWTQCEPCVACFKQDQPLFNTKSSSSYRKMPVKHELAKEFVCDASKTCHYRVQYFSGQSSTGIASVENFTFKTDTGVPYMMNGLVFGCGIMNSGSFGTKTAITGILGMNKGPVSFARQIGVKMIKSRFSYCLPRLKANAKETYLRFGDKAIMRTKNYKTSPFLNLKKEPDYILKLNDISICGKRLGLKKGSFTKGCLIDSGTAVSHIEGKAYSALKTSLKNYFSKFKKIGRINPGRGLEYMLCYSNSVPFTKFPNMTFHFQGADLDIPPENLFIVERNFFCLEIIASTSRTILGAYQQQNMRFLFDLDKAVISFAKEDCSKDAP